MAAAESLVRLILAGAAAFAALLAGEAGEWARWADRAARGPAPAVAERESSRDRAERTFGGRDAWRALPAAERERILTLFDAFDVALARDDRDLMIRAMRAYVEDGLPGAYRTATAVDVAKRMAARGEVDEALAVLDLIKPGEPREPEAALRAAEILYDAGRFDEARVRLRDLKPQQGPQSARFGGVDRAYAAAKLMAFVGDRDRARQFYMATEPAGDEASGRRFMFLGRLFAFDLRLAHPGALPEAYSFQANLVKKYPELAGPEDLASVGRLAWDMAERDETDVETQVRYEDAADETLELMKTRFPDHPETARGRLMRAFRATNDRDYRRAAAELTEALRSDALTPELRSDLLLEAKRLRERTGVALPTEGGTEPPEPTPDPAFPPAAEAPPGR